MVNKQFSLIAIFISFLIRSTLKSYSAPVFDTQAEDLPAECDKIDLFRDCAAVTSCTQRSGIYTIQNEKLSEVFLAACDAETENGDWFIIQKRQDGSVDFYRNWTEYENGFGDIEGEYFIGLKKLHALTNFNGPQELLILMEDNNGAQAFAKYDSFAIGSATEMYKLKRLGKYVKRCQTSNLNGKYGNNISWSSFRDRTVSLSYIKIMIRRSRAL